MKREKYSDFKLIFLILMISFGKKFMGFDSMLFAVQGKAIKEKQVVEMRVTQTDKGESTIERFG